MRYFILLLFGLIFILTGCAKKLPSSTPSPTIGSIGREMTPDSHSDEIMPAPAPSPMIDAESVAPPADVHPDRMIAESMTSSSSAEPMMIPIPQQAIQSGILTAADIDDNLNLNYFQKYVNRVLQSTKENVFPFMSTKDRVKLTIEDTNGKGINRVKVKVGDFIGYTNSQGILYLFPSVDKIPTQTTLELNGKSKPIDLSTQKEFTITFNKTSSLPKSLDLMFVVDTTGSMGDEMRYLAKEFDAIVSNVKEKHPDVQIRFGLTLYRDKGDEYVIRNFEFTSDVKTMKEQFKKQSAKGGGDYPEAMEEGVEKALEASWRAEDGVRMMFLVADAPPHDENIKQMVPIIELAREKGIHIYSLGASGVAEKAEYIMRHLALFTQGRYLWLTDDSGVGNSHKEPKVNCYQVTRLDQLISRVIQSELSGKRIEADSDSILRTVGSYQNGICQ